MRINKLIIKNLRCFAQQTINFIPQNVDATHDTNGAEIDGFVTRTVSVSNINLVIGNNGTGKTTLFQALTIAAIGPYLASNASGFRTPPMIRSGEDIAETRATLLLSSYETAGALMPEHPPTVSVNIKTSDYKANSIIKHQGAMQFLTTPKTKNDGWKNILFEEDHPGCFLAAYGANRRTERPEAYNERLRGVRYQRVASLFEAHVGMIPLSLAYQRCKEHDRWEEVVEIVNQLLWWCQPHQPPLVRLTPDQIKDGEPLFDYDGIPLPITEISDGYRLFLGWLIDCLTHLAIVVPPEMRLNDAVGIVIVDEIDLFLSPGWRRTVLESLSNTFPRIQWFCSTHSALVAGSVESANIYLLKRSAPFTSKVYHPSDKFEGKSVDEVLVELFDVQQPRSPHLQRQLSDLAERAMQGDIEASLLYLRRLNEGSGQLR